jgi:hypothetical protein
MNTGDKCVLQQDLNYPIVKLKRGIIAEIVQIDQYTTQLKKCSDDTVFEIFTSMLLKPEWFLPYTGIQMHTVGVGGRAPGLISTPAKSEFPKEYNGDMSRFHKLTQEEFSKLKSGDLVITLESSNLGMAFLKGQIFKVTGIDSIGPWVNVENDNEGHPNGFSPTVVALYREGAHLGCDEHALDALRYSIGHSLNQKPTTAPCTHPNKKVVPMLNKSFWYCPDCKSDLGDA